MHTLGSLLAGDHRLSSGLGKCIKRRADPLSAVLRDLTLLPRTAPARDLEDSDKKNENWQDDHGSGRAGLKCSCHWWFRLQCPDSPPRKDFEGTPGAAPAR